MRIDGSIARIRARDRLVILDGRLRQEREPRSRQPSVGVDAVPGVHIRDRGELEFESRAPRRVRIAIAATDTNAVRHVRRCSAEIGSPTICTTSKTGADRASSLAISRDLQGGHEIGGFNDLGAGTEPDDLTRDGRLDRKLRFHTLHDEQYGAGLHVLSEDSDVRPNTPRDLRRDVATH